MNIITMTPKSKIEKKLCITLNKADWKVVRSLINKTPGMNYKTDGLTICNTACEVAASLKSMSEIIDGIAFIQIMKHILESLLIEGIEWLGELANNNSEAHIDHIKSYKKCLKKWRDLQEQKEMWNIKLNGEEKEKEVSWKQSDIVVVAHYLRHNEGSNMRHYLNEKVLQLLEKASDANEELHEIESEGWRLCIEVSANEILINTLYLMK